MRVIGLTGGIASGKSTVAEILRKLGVQVIDADQLARDVVIPGEPAYNAIVAEFGTEILYKDGTINRPALGKVVFGDPAARVRLQAITHPAIARRAEEQLHRLRTLGAEVVVYMAPLLIEAGATSRVDEIWVVHVDKRTQLRRVMERDKVTLEEAGQKLAAQMPIEEKKEYGSVVIDNCGTLHDLEKLVYDLWEKEIANGGKQIK